jgi:hypothetical protein
MKTKGIEVLGLLPWYSTSSSGWQTYVQNEVNAAPDLPAWEIGNEPEDSWWGGPMSTSTYMTLLQQAYAIIKAANPNAIIVGPAVGATTGVSYLLSLIKLGLLNYVDVVSCHYYIYYSQTNITGIESDVAGRKPIWITETGWTTADQPGGEAAQNQYVKNYYNRTSGILGSDPAIQVIFHYELNDMNYPAPKGQDDGWGLTYGPQGNYGKKLAYATFKSYLAVTVGGIWVPVDKFVLFAPYIGLTILLAVAVITVGYAKKRKRNPQIISQTNNQRTSKMRVELVRVLKKINART